MERLHDRRVSLCYSIGVASLSFFMEESLVTRFSRFFFAFSVAAEATDLLARSLEDEAESFFSLPDFMAVLARFISEPSD